MARKIPPPYRGTTRPPFDRVAPDGRAYFDLLGPPHGLVKLYGSIVNLIDVCNVKQAQALRNKQTVVAAYWRGQVATLDAALAQFQNDLRNMEVEMAAKAEASVIHHIKRTQVRPDTSKSTHMVDNIVCRPVKTGTVPLGLVGIGEIAALNRTRRSRGGQYWSAQEFGTDAHVGRILPGYFMPGKVRPSQAEVQQQPEFRRQSRGRGTPAMVIKEPIHERGFLRRGIDDTGRLYKRKMATIEAKLIRALQKVAAAPPPLPVGPQQRRR